MRFLFVLTLLPSLLLSQTTQDIPLRSDVSRLLDAGDVVGAERTVRSYLSGHEDSGEAHYLLGYVLFKKHDPKGSLAEYTTAARYRKPGSYDLETVASDYVLLKDYSDADKWFSASVDMDPSNLSALYYLGRTKYNENRFEEAISAFESCLKRDPNNTKYEDNLGLAYEGLGRNEEAEASFRTALDGDRAASSHNFAPYLDLGKLLADSNRIADAIPYLVQAAQMAPKDLRVRTALGSAYLHANQLEKAQAELETASALDPRDAPTHFLLAQVYRRRGLLDQAHRESEKYTELNRDHSTDR